MFELQFQWHHKSTKEFYKYTFFFGSGLELWLGCWSHFFYKFINKDFVGANLSKNKKNGMEIFLLIYHLLHTSVSYRGCQENSSFSLFSSSFSFFMFLFFSYYQTLLALKISNFSNIFFGDLIFVGIFYVYFLGEWNKQPSEFGCTQPFFNFFIIIIIKIIYYHYY